MFLFFFPRVISRYLTLRESLPFLPLALVIKPVFVHFCQLGTMGVPFILCMSNSGITYFVDLFGYSPKLADVLPKAVPTGTIPSSESSSLAEDVWLPRTPRRI